MFKDRAGDIHLTGKESELLELLTKCEGGVVPNGVIDCIFDPEGSTDCTRNRHNLVSRLRTILGKEASITTHRGYGYILEKPGS